MLQKRCWGLPAPVASSCPLIVHRTGNGQRCVSGCHSDGCSCTALSPLFTPHSCSGASRCSSRTIHELPGAVAFASFAFPCTSAIPAPPSRGRSELAKPDYPTGTEQVHEVFGAELRSVLQCCSPFARSTYYPKTIHLSPSVCPYWRNSPSAANDCRSPWRTAAESPAAVQDSAGGAWGPRRSRRWRPVGAAAEAPLWSARSDGTRGDGPEP